MKNSVDSPGYKEGTIQARDGAVATLPTTSSKCSDTQDVKSCSITQVKTHFVFLLLICNIYFKILLYSHQNVSSDHNSFSQVKGYLDFSGIKEGSILFDTHDKHFYHFSNNKWKCADYQYSDIDNPKPKRSVDKKCQVERGETHDHLEVPLRSIEFHLFVWRCKLKILEHHTDETTAQSVDYVVANWPRKPLPFPIDQSNQILFQKLKTFREKADNKKVFEENYLKRLGHKPYETFFEYLTPLIVDTASPGTKIVYFCLASELFIIL